MLNFRRELKNSQQPENPELRTSLEADLSLQGTQLGFSYYF